MSFDPVVFLTIWSGLVGVPTLIFAVGLDLLNKSGADQLMRMGLWLVSAFVVGSWALLIRAFMAL